MRGGKLFFGAAIVGLTAIFACADEEENPSKSPSTGGSSSGAAATPEDAKNFYTSKVNAQITATCAQCHQLGKSGAPVFLGASADASYVAIEGFPGLISAPSASPLVQKGVHSGPALTQTQSELVTAWLKLEVSARKLSGDDNAPKNLRAAFKAFGACMDYAKWKQYKLHTLPLMETENNQGQCRSCHNYGQGSLWLSGGGEKDEQDNAITFLKFTQFPYVQRLVVGRVKAAAPGTKDQSAGDGSFDGVESSRRIIDKGNEAQQQQANSHPRFALTSDMSNNLAAFVRETIDLMNQGPCTTSSVPDAGSYDAAAVAPR